jgi:hypothetical protein
MLEDVEVSLDFGTNCTEAPRLSQDIGYETEDEDNPVAIARHDAMAL